jgi:hypothetical protein
VSEQLEQPNMNLRLIILAGVLIATNAFPVFAEVPDLGPPAGATAAIAGEPGSTEVVYKTLQVWEQSEQGDTWAAGKAASVEAGTKVKVRLQANPDSPAPLLAQVLILTGDHAGEIWWIHSNHLKVLQSRRRANPSKQ